MPCDVSETSSLENVCDGIEGNIDFFVHAGDIIYYDNLSKNKAMAHYHWDRMFSLPTNKSFHAQVTSYFEKDDYDLFFVLILIY